jgi:hypothetical protein
MKQCKKCLENKELDNFYNNRQNKDGKNSYCKPCQSEYSKEIYDKKYERKFPREKFIDGKRYCTICKEYLELDKFKRTNYSWCAECHVEKDKKDYDKKRKYPRKTDEQGKIHCRRCDKYLDGKSFTRYNQSYCKPCSEYMGAFYNLRKLGMTPERYFQMEKKQSYVCKICGETDNKRLSVDHDHSCCNSYPNCGNCVRGLLCSRCNRTLGIVNDDTNLLNKMINYLKNQ